VTACAQGEDDSDEEEKKDGEDDFFGSSLLHGHIGTGAPADGAPNPEADAELQAQVLAEMSAEELQKQLVGVPVSATSSSTLCSEGPDSCEIHGVSCVYTQCAGGGCFASGAPLSPGLRRLVLVACCLLHKRGASSLVVRQGDDVNLGDIPAGYTEEVGSLGFVCGTRDGLRALPSMH
jgi:hypothetical protein